MASAFIFDSDSIGQSDYDEMMKAIGREMLDAPAPEGVLAHIAGPKPGGGWQVVDVWESEEAADAFYGSDQFLPVVREAERAGMRLTLWPLHRAELYNTVRKSD